MYKMAKKSDGGVEMSAIKIIASETRQLIKTREEETLRNSRTPSDRRTSINPRAAILP
jgi:hypothetical protein